MTIINNKSDARPVSQAVGAGPALNKRSAQVPTIKRVADSVVKSAAPAAVDAPPRKAPVAIATPKAPVKKNAAQEMPTVALDDATRIIAANVQGLEANHRGTRAQDLVPASAAAANNGSAVTAYSAVVGLGPNMDTPTVAADRQSVLVNENLHIHGHTDSIYAGTAGGVQMLGANIQETGDLSTNFLTLATPDFLAPVVFQKFHVAGLTAQVGVAGLAAGRSGIKVLAEKPGFVQVEQQRKRTLGGLLLAGIHNGAVGVAARLTVIDERETILRRWMTPDAAAELLHRQDKGFRSYAHSKAIALGFAKPLIGFPKLDKPESLKNHDEMICTVRGSVTGTLALASNVLLTGFDYTRTGEFELVVHRKKEDTEDAKDMLNVVITPKNVGHSFAIFIDVPILADIRSVLSKSTGTRHGYAFDLGDPKAVAAYHSLLAGKLPGASVVLDGVSIGDAVGLVSALKQEKLPSGVSRLFSEHVEVNETSHGAALTLPRYLPFLGWAGISTERRATRSKHLIGAEGSSVATEADTVLYETQRMHMGVQTEESSVKAHRVSSSDSSESSVEGVVIGASYTVDRTRGKNRNHLSKTLNEQWLPEEKKVADFEVKKKNNPEQSYKVSLKRTLGSDDMGRLMELATQDDVVETASPAIRSLLSALVALGDAGVKNPDLTRPLFAKYASRTGAGGLGELHRFIGGDEKLQVQPESSADKDVAASKMALNTKYHKPMNPLEENKSDLNKRVAEVTGGIKRAQRSADDLLSDPLLKKFNPKKLDENVKQVKADQHAMRKLIATDHLGVLGRTVLEEKLSNKSKQRISKYLPESKQGKKT